MRQGTLTAADIALDYSVRGLCVRPYHGHPKGCPNFNKKEGCPPSAPSIENVLDLVRPIWLVYNQFDFASHVARLRAKHPKWTQRQLECCLYWQGTARKQLKAKIALTLAELGPAAAATAVVLTCPEACGINITETMRRAGVELEWPPINYTYQVALIGQPSRM